jgi:hypothetical protein
VPNPPCQIGRRRAPLKLNYIGTTGADAQNNAKLHLNVAAFQRAESVTLKLTGYISFRYPVRMRLRAMKVFTVIRK